MKTKAYWVCRQEAGLGVIWKCREQSEAMKKCIADYSGDKDAFAKYRDERFAELAPKYFAHRAALLEAKHHHYSTEEGAAHDQPK